jgi:hypothetical protein
MSQKTKGDLSAEIILDSWFFYNCSEQTKLSRNSWQETKKIHIKLAVTSNKNKQQQDAKNNAE